MHAPPSSQFVGPYEKAVPSSDGIDMMTDIYLPRGGGPWPVVLMRTPYGRRRPGMVKLASMFAKEGFATLLQGMRGRYRTAGKFFSREGPDGLDTLAWLSQQDWSNGRVALVGISLSSYSLFLLATLPPPPGIEIRTVINIMGAVHLHAAFYPGGALMLHWALPWSSMLHEQWNRAMGRWQQLAWDELFQQLPLATASERVEGTIHLWDELIVQHPACGEVWAPYDLRQRLQDLEIPVLHLGGWYDNALGQVLMGYDQLRQSTQAANQSLLLGPWDHQTIFIAILGSRVDSTRLGHAAPINLAVPLGDWCRRWLYPEAEANDPQPSTLIFVMGENVWLGAETFPLPDTQVMDWYLGSGGHARSAAGDGRLQPEVASEPGRDTFVYDPNDPVPTRGGALWPFARVGLVPGPEEQGEVEARDDVLVYTSAPLAEKLVVVGRLELELWAASSCPDTDFTAKLVDVDPDGKAHIVQDGILRARFRASDSEVRFLEPGRPYRLEISLQATGHAFQPGHRLRLEVSSSNFPKYDRNLNTRTPTQDETTSEIARQQIFHGGDKASRLRLPVLPSDMLAARRWTPPTSWLAPPRLSAG